MRQSYIEKELLLEQNTQTRQLEERNEQLQAEKERLMYDNALQRRGRPIEDDDDRSAIRRGLLAGPASRVCIGDRSLGPAAIPVDAGSSKAGALRPSDPPPAGPPSLPPGPPSSKCSSTSGESIVSIYLSNEPSAPPLTAEQYYAEMAARAIEQGAGMVPCVNRAGAEGDRHSSAPPSHWRHPSTGAAPLTWEDADQQYYAEITSRSDFDQGMIEQWNSLSDAERAKWEALSEPAIIVPSTSTRPETISLSALLEPAAQGTLLVNRAAAEASRQWLHVQAQSVSVHAQNSLTHAAAATAAAAAAAAYAGDPVDDACDAVEPTVPSPSPPAEASSDEPEQLAAEALAGMSRSAGSAGTRQSVDSFTVEVVEPEDACAVQSRDEDRPAAALGQQCAGWPRLTGGSAGVERSVRGGKVRAVGSTEGPSLPLLALGANVCPPASWPPVQADTQRFRHRVDPSSSGSAVAMTCAGAQRVAEHADRLAGHEGTHAPHTEMLSLAPPQSFERIWALGAGFGAALRLTLTLYPVP